MSYYDDASLIMYPSGYKADKIYSLKPTDGSGDFDFARASSATRVNADGLIESVATGVPRIDYTGGGCGKLLLEGQRTNFIPYSTLDFNGGSKPEGWSIGFGTGSFSYEQLTYKGQKAVKQTQITTGRSYLDTGTITILANTDYNLKIQFILDECVADDNDIICSVNGFGVFQLITFNQIDSNGVLNINFTSTTTTTGSIRVGLGTSANEDGGKSLAWAIPQVEAGSYPTSYIPTAGATATRLADSASKTGISSLINSSEGTLFTEISAFTNGGVSRRISIGDGSNDNRVSLEMDENASTLKGFMSSGGTLVGQVEFVGIDQTDNLKIALTYSDSAFSLFINGVKRDTDTTISSTPIGLDRLFYSSAAGSLAFEGTQKQLMIFPTALSDAKLETLISWTSFIEMATDLKYTIE